MGRLGTGFGSLIPTLGPTPRTAVEVPAGQTVAPPRHAGLCWGLTRFAARWHHCPRRAMAGRLCCHAHRRHERAADKLAAELAAAGGSNEAPSRNEAAP